jgi:hypothetical protein
MHITVAWYRTHVNDKWQVYKTNTQLFEIEKIIGRSMTQQLQEVFKVMSDEAEESTRLTILSGS